MSKPVSDIDGRTMNHPAEGSELAQNPRWVELAVLERWVMFCRRNNIRCAGPVRVGEIVVQVEDLEVGRGSGGGVSDPGAWSALGGYSGRESG